jgi:thiol-disulfide isomerase/thioredoxin
MHPEDRIMRLASTALFILLLLSSAPAADDSASDLKSVLKDYQAAQGEIIKAYRAAESEAERQKLLGKYRKLPVAFADKFLAVAEKDPKDGAAFEAAAWVVANAGEAPAADKALAILIKEHIKDEKIGRACLQASENPSAVGTRLARAVLENGPNDTAQGQACYALAHILSERSEQAFQKKKPEDSARLAAEAEKLFELVQEKFADVKGLRGTLGALAKSDLYELRNLAVGKTVPEIEGEDIDGKKFKLSDYRGKVVLVDFWGHWCGPCRAAYPHNRELVKRLEDKPFALVGVNSDRDKDTIKKAMEKEENSWRYWFDGGSTSGPIAKKFNVHGWPTFYLIDHKGVIRLRSVGAPDSAELDKTLDELLAEAKSSGK